MFRSALALFATSLALATVACGNSSASDDVADLNAEGALRTDSAGTLSCPGLGTSNQSFVEQKDGSIVVTVEGASTQTGTKVDEPNSDGFTVYRHFQPANGFIRDEDALWVSKTTMKVQLRSDNVNTMWDSTCHKATREELDQDQCLPLLGNLGFLDTNKRPKTEKVSDKQFKLTYKDPGDGDVVWTVATKRRGRLCELGAIRAVSCSAIVVDAINKQSRDDGSSSGQPFFKKDSAGKYEGGIHDEESGEFAYVIETSSDDDHCRVTSIKSTIDEH